jgi:hypothetical protein
MKIEPFAYDTLDTDELVAGLHSPDYSDSWKTGARAALSQRGVTHAQIETKNPLRALAVTGDRPLPPLSLNAVASGARLRRVTRWSLAWVRIAVVSAFLTLAHQENGEPIGAVFIAVILYLALRIPTAAVIAVPLRLVEVTVSSLRPPRLLLLRPFNNRTLAGALKPFVRRHVARYGHVYTLQDDYFSNPTVEISGWWLSWLLVHPNIRSEWDLDRLRRHLQRARGTFTWLARRNGVIPVASSHEWWQRTMHQLASSCDAIVMDISQSTEGLMWELQELRTLELKSRVVFVAHSDHHEDAAILLKRCFPGSDLTLHTYHDWGWLLDTSFHRAMCATISASV